MIAGVEFAEDGSFRYYGYTEEELGRAFDAVSDPEDWKAPIAAYIPGEVFDIVYRAIVFYTSTVPSGTYVPSEGRWIIRADGYRMGPAGDH